MTCVCGHSDDLHESIDGNFEWQEFGECTACDCKEFSEDIDRDELEIE